MPHFKAKQRLVVMGVAGCGKSSVGASVAEALGATYIDGDDLHPASNVAKMSSCQPLTDDDRWPWLSNVGERLRNATGTTIIGCSALKRSYREYITQEAQAPVMFVYLEGTPELIAERLAARSGHFMPPELLQSQFDTLEPPAADELAVALSISQPLDVMVREAIGILKGDRH